MWLQSYHQFITERFGEAQHHHLFFGGGPSLRCMAKNHHSYPHTLMYFHRTLTQCSLGRVVHVTSTGCGVKGYLGIIGHLASFQKMITVSTYFDVF